MSERCGGFYYLCALNQFNVNTLLYLSNHIYDDIVSFRLYFSVAAIFTTILLMSVTNRNKMSRFVEHHVKWIALSVFLSGIVLYFIGFWDGGSSGNVITLLLRATLSSLEMFVSQSDLLEVRHSMHENGIYMLFFAITHFLAVFISAIFIIPFIAYVLHSRRILRSTHKSKLFIFWGQSDNSFLLAEDIVKTQTDKDYMIVFVELPSEDAGGSLLHFTHLFSGSLFKNDKMNRVRQLNALLINSNDTILCRNEGYSLQQVLKEAGVEFLYKAILRDNFTDINFFFLSDNHDQNVKNAASLISTTEVKNSPILKKRINTYCNSPYNELCITYSYTSLSRRVAGKNNVGFNITDSARLAVVELKSNADYHPVSFLRVNTETATVENPFRALILGFDTTGEEMMKYLYEYSSLINTNGEKNPTTIFITNTKVVETHNQFLMKYPALRNSKEIQLVDEGVHTSEFKTWLATSSENLSYIVICSGNDVDNMNFTNVIYKIACRRRSAKSGKLVIFVRSYSQDYYNELNDIATYYNTYNKQSNIEIVVFGSKKSIFTYRSVVEQHTINNARMFYESYIKYTNYKESWIEQYLKLSSTYAQHQELACRLNQNMSNWFHIATKMHLCGADVDKEKLRRLCECVASRPPMEHYRNELESAATLEEKAMVVQRYCSYANATESEQTLLNNLAKCEYLRWRALMVMLGYIPDAEVTNEDGTIRKDHANKKHARITTIERLKQDPTLRETIPYNHTVVDVSLMIAAREE